MSRQFNRVISVTIFDPTRAVDNGLEISGLRIAVTIEKDILGLPNRGKIEIYNLSGPTISRIEKEFTRIVVNAGYEGDVGILFIGNIANVFHVRKGADIITEIYAADGLLSYNSSYFAQTVGQNVRAPTVVRTVANSFTGLKIGLMEGIPNVNSSLTGQTLVGSSKDVMNKLSADYNFSWSIQNETIQTFSRASSLTAIVRELSSETGMIDNPTLTEIGANAKVLMDRTINPGNRFVIKASHPNIKLSNAYMTGIKPTPGKGIYRVNKVTHTGDNYENKWESVIEGFIVL